MPTPILELATLDLQATTAPGFSPGTQMSALFADLLTHALDTAAPTPQPEANSVDAPAPANAPKSAQLAKPKPTTQSSQTKTADSVAASPGIVALTPAPIDTKPTPPDTEAAIGSANTNSGPEGNSSAYFQASGGAPRLSPPHQPQPVSASGAWDSVKIEDPNFFGASPASTCDTNESPRAPRTAVASACSQESSAESAKLCTSANGSAPEVDQAKPNARTDVKAIGSLSSEEISEASVFRSEETSEASEFRSSFSAWFATWQAESDKNHVAGSEPQNEIPSVAAVRTGQPGQVSPGPLIDAETVSPETAQPEKAVSSVTVPSLSGAAIALSAEAPDSQITAKGAQPIALQGALGLKPLVTNDPKPQPRGAHFRSSDARNTVHSVSPEAKLDVAAAAKSDGKEGHPSSGTNENQHAQAEGNDTSAPRAVVQETVAQPAPPQAKQSSATDINTTVVLRVAAAGQANATEGTTSVKREPSDTPATISAPAPQSPPPAQVHLARIFQSSAQSEMRIGLRTQTFGTVQVRTTVSDRQVDIALGGERGDLRNVFASELPSLQTSLQQHDLNLQHVRALPDSPAGHAGDSSFGSGRQQQRFSRPAAPGPLSYESADVDDAQVLIDLANGLNVRA